MQCHFSHNTTESQVCEWINHVFRGDKHQVLPFVTMSQTIGMHKASLQMMKYTFQYKQF